MKTIAFIILLVLSIPLMVHGEGLSCKLFKSFAQFSNQPPDGIFDPMHELDNTDWICSSGGFPINMSSNMSRFDAKFTSSSIKIQINSLTSCGPVSVSKSAHSDESNVLVEYHIDTTCQTQALGSLNVHYSLVKKVRHNPFSSQQLISDVVGVWSGIVTSDQCQTQGGSCLYDHNVFDGQTAYLYRNIVPFTTGQPSDIVRNIIMDGLDVSHAKYDNLTSAALAVDSLRGVYASLPSDYNSYQVMRGEMYLPGKNQFIAGELWTVLYQSTPTSKNEIAIKYMYMESVESSCGEHSVQLTPNFAQNSVSAALFHDTSDNYHVVSMYATCVSMVDMKIVESESLIGFVSYFTNIPDVTPWNSFLLNTNTNSYKQVLQSLKNSFSASIYGAFKNDGQLYTSIGADLLLDDNPLTFIKDVEINNFNMVDNIKLQFVNQYSTGIDIFDTPIQQFMTSDIQCISNLRENTNILTLKRYLLKCFNFNNVLFSSDANSANLVYYQTSRMNTISLTDSALTKIKQTLKIDIDPKVESCVRKGMVVVQAVVSNLLNPSSLVLSSETTIQKEGSAELQLTYEQGGLFISSTSVKGYYDYNTAYVHCDFETNILHKQFTQSTTDDRGNIVNSESITLANYNYLERLLPKVSNRTSIVPIIENNFDDMCEKFSVREAILSIEKLFIENSGKNIQTVSLSTAINNFLSQFCDVDSDLVQVQPSVFPSNGGFTIMLSVKRLQLVKLAKRNMFSRTENRGNPVIVSTFVKIWIAPSFLNFIEYSNSAITTYNNLRLPFRYNYQSGVMMESQLSINIKLPQFDVSLNSKFYDRNLDTFSMSLQSNDKSLEPLIQFSGNAFITEQGILSSMQNIFHLPARIFSGPLNLPVGFLNKYLRELQDWNLEETMWLESTNMVSDTNLIFSGITFPSSSNSLKEMLVEVNDHIFTCKSGMKYSDLKSFSDTLNDALTNCNLSEMFTVSLPEKSKSLEVRSDSKSQIYKSYLVLNTIDGSSYNSTYQSSASPTYGSWDDVAWIFSSIFNKDFIPPKLTKIPTSTLRSAEPFMSDYYPKYLNGYMLDFSMEKSYEKNVDLANNISPNQNIGINIKGSTTTNFHIHMQSKIGIAFDAPPLGNITMSTNASSQVTLDTIITGATNAFNIKFTYQKLVKGQQILDPPINSNILLYLPVGRSVRDVLTNWIPAQLPQPIRSMFYVGKVQSFFSISPLESDTQLEIFFKRAKYDENTYYAPVGMSIISNVPCIPLSSNYPSNSYLFVADTKVEAQLSFTPIISEITGHIGFFDLKISEPPFAGGMVKFSLNQKNPFDIDGYFLDRLQVNDTILEVLDLSIMNDISLSIKNPVADLMGSLHVPSLDFITFELKGAWDRLTNELFKQVQTSILESQVFLNSTEQIVIDTYHGLAKTNTSSFCGMMESVITKLQDSATKLGAQKVPFINKSINDLLHNSITEKFLQIRPNVCQSLVGTTVEIFCKLLKNAFGQPICQGFTLSETQLQLKLKLDNYILNSQDSILLPSSLFDAHSSELAAVVGYEGYVHFQTISSFEFNVLTSLTDFNVHILEGSTVEIDSRFSAGGNIDAEMGPVHLTLGESDLDVNVKFKATKRKSGIDFEFDGNGKFNTVISYFDYSICQLEMSFPHLFKILTGEEKVIVNGQCRDGDFKKTIQKLLHDNTLLELFKNPGSFKRKWIEGWNQLKEKFHPLLEDFIVPLLDNKIRDLLMKPLEQYTSSKISNEIVGGIITMVNSLLLNQTVHIDPILLDQIVLDEVTLLICQLLPVKHCPKSPSAKQNTFIWPLEFGSTLNQPINLLKFDLGSKTNTELKSTIGLNSTLSYDFKFNLIFNRTHGLSFNFDDGEVFKASISLDTNGGSELSGRFGFIGAAVVIDPSSKFQADVSVIKKKDQWDFSPHIQSKLVANFELGLVGIIQEIKDQSVVKDLEAYPHIMMSAEFDWDYKKGQKSTSPIMKVSQPSICLGTMVQKIALQIREKMELFLHPLEPYFGKDGVLLKKIPTTQFIYGREMNLAELAVYLARTRGAHMKGVEETLKALNTLFEIYQKLKKLEDIIGSTGKCGITTQMAKSFVIDFSKSEPELFDLNMDIDPNIVFPDFVPQSQRMEFETTFSATVVGEFSFHFTLMEDKSKIPVKVLLFILGQHVELFRVNIPGLRFSFDAHSQRFPIFAPPLIQIRLSFQASVIVQPPPIAFTTRGIESVIRNGDLSGLFKSVMFANQDIDGSPLYVVHGVVIIRGEVILDLKFLEGYGYAELIIDFKAHLGSVNYDGGVYLDELSHLSLLRAFDYSLAMYVQLGVGLRLCIPLLFDKICYDLIEINTGPMKFWGANYPHEPVQPATSKDGHVTTGYLQLHPPTLPHRNGKSRDLDLVKFIISFNPISGKIEVSLQLPTGRVVNTPWLTTSADGKIIIFGNTPSIPFTIVFGVGSTISAPQSITNYLVITADTEEWTQPIEISSTSIKTKKRSYLNMVGCIEQSFDPTTAASFKITSFACSSIFGGNSNHFLISNTNTNDFEKFGPIKLTEGIMNSVTMTTPSPTYYVDSQRISPSIEALTSSSPLQNVQIRNDAPCSYKLGPVDVSSKIELVCGVGNDNVEAKLNDIFGGVNILGGEGINSVDFLIDNLEKRSAEQVIMLTASNVLVDKIHCVSYQDIVERRVHLNNQEKSTIIHLSPTQKISTTKYILNTELNSNTNVNITECQTTHSVYVERKGGGNVEVSIGQGSLKNVKCTINVYTSDFMNTKLSISLDASKDTDVSYQVKCVASRCSVFDTSNTKSTLQIIFVGVESIDFTMSDHEKNLFVLTQGTIGTQITATFPGGKGIICKNERENPTLLSQFLQLNFGPFPFACDFDHEPTTLLDYILSPVVVSGYTGIYFGTDSIKNQYINAEYNCLNSTKPDGRSIVQLDIPSSNFIEKVSRVMTRTTPNIFCQMVLDTFTSVYFHTGSGDDSFRANHMTLQYLVADLMDGANKIHLENSTTVFNISTNRGSYRATFVSPLTLVEFTGKTVSAERGVIDAYVLPSTNLKNDILYPVSKDDPHSKIVIKKSPYDILSLYRNGKTLADNVHVAKYSNPQSSLNQNDNVVYVDADIPFSVVKTDVVSDYTFLTNTCADGSTLIFHAQEQQNWLVVYNSSSLATPCFVYGDFVSDTNGTMLINAHVEQSHSFTNYVCRMDTHFPDRSFEMRCGNLQLYVTDLKNLITNSLWPVIYELNGTPEQTGIILKNFVRSTVNLNGPVRDNVMVFESETRLIGEDPYTSILQEATRLIVVGGESTTTINNSVGDFTLNGTCMTNSFSTMEKYNVNDAMFIQSSVIHLDTNKTCDIYTKNTKGIYIQSRNNSAQYQLFNVDQSSTSLVDLINFGTVYLQDTNLYWENATLENSKLTVSGVLTVNTRLTHNFTIVSQFDSLSNLLLKDVIIPHVRIGNLNNLLCYENIDTSLCVSPHSHTPNVTISEAFLDRFNITVSQLSQSQGLRMINTSLDIQYFKALHERSFQFNTFFPQSFPTNTFIWFNDVAISNMRIDTSNLVDSPKEILIQFDDYSTSYILFVNEQNRNTTHITIDGNHTMYENILLSSNPLLTEYQENGPVETAINGTLPDQKVFNMNIHSTAIILSKELNNSLLFRNGKITIQDDTNWLNGVVLVFDNSEIFAHTQEIIQSMSNCFKFGEKNNYSYPIHPLYNEYVREWTGNSFEEIDKVCHLYLFNVSYIDFKSSTSMTLEDLLNVISVGAKFNSPQFNLKDNFEISCLDIDSTMITFNNAKWIQSESKIVNLDMNFTRYSEISIQNLHQSISINVAKEEMLNVETEYGYLKVGKLADIFKVFLKDTRLRNVNIFPSSLITNDDPVTMYIEKTTIKILSMGLTSTPLLEFNFQVDGIDKLTIDFTGMKKPTLFVSKIANFIQSIIVIGSPILFIDDECNNISIFGNEIMLDSTFITCSSKFNFINNTKLHSLELRENQSPTFITSMDATAIINSTNSQVLLNGFRYVQSDCNINTTLITTENVKHVDMKCETNQFLLKNYIQRVEPATNIDIDKTFLMYAQDMGVTIEEIESYSFIIKGKHLSMNAPMATLTLPTISAIKVQTSIKTTLNISNVYINNVQIIHQGISQNIFNLANDLELFTNILSITKQLFICGMKDSTIRYDFVGETNTTGNVCLNCYGSVNILEIFSNNSSLWSGSIEKPNSFHLHSISTLYLQITSLNILSNDTQISFDENNIEITNYSSIIWETNSTLSPSIKIENDKTYLDIKHPPLNQLPVRVDEITNSTTSISIEKGNSILFTIGMTYQNVFPVQLDVNFNDSLTETCINPSLQCTEQYIKGDVNQFGYSPCLNVDMCIGRVVVIYSPMNDLSCKNVGNTSQISTNDPTQPHTIISPPSITIEGYVFFVISVILSIVLLSFGMVDSFPSSFISTASLYNQYQAFPNLFTIEGRALIAQSKKLLLLGSGWECGNGIIVSNQSIALMVVIGAICLLAIVSLLIVWLMKAKNNKQVDVMKKFVRIVFFLLLSSIMIFTPWVMMNITTSWPYVNVLFTAIILFVLVTFIESRFNSSISYNEDITMDNTRIQRRAFSGMLRRIILHCSKLTTLIMITSSMIILILQSSMLDYGEGVVVWRVLRFILLLTSMVIILTPIIHRHRKETTTTHRKKFGISMSITLSIVVAMCGLATCIMDCILVVMMDESISYDIFHHTSDDLVVSLWRGSTLISIVSSVLMLIVVVMVKWLSGSISNEQLNQQQLTMDHTENITSGEENTKLLSTSNE